jgi:hypothetical protein
MDSWRSPRPVRVSPGASELSGSTPLQRVDDLDGEPELRWSAHETHRPSHRLHRSVNRFGTGAVLLLERQCMNGPAGIPA